MKLKKKLKKIWNWLNEPREIDKKLGKENSFYNSEII